MTGKSTGPKTESIVVLGSNDHLSEPCFFEYRYPLSCIEFGGIKKSRVFIAIAPFLVGVGIDGEVQESQDSCRGVGTTWAAFRRMASLVSVVEIDTRLAKGLCSK